MDGHRVRFGPWRPSPRLVDYGVATRRKRGRERDHRAGQRAGRRQSRCATGWIPRPPTACPRTSRLIYPFMPPSTLNDDVRRRRRARSSRPSRPSRSSWRGSSLAASRLPRPDPAEPFRRLTAALAAAFPDYPPYGGRHDDVVPHLTVAQSAGRLPTPPPSTRCLHSCPIRDVAREAWLIGHTPEQPWHTLWRLPLGPPGLMPAAEHPRR